jgi:2'-5' RNA ligase
MKKRIFLGFEISYDLRKKIIKWQNNFSFYPQFRFVKPKNLHITLIPPWYEDDLEKKILLIRKAILAQSKKPFFIDFFKIRPGPSKRNASLIWLEGKKNKYAEKLVKSITSYLCLSESKRNFIPHITLARTKKCLLN